MTPQWFSVDFHQPFLIRSGVASGGVDAVARRDAPLPASSLKGVMRHAAEHVLGVMPPLVAEVFGEEGRRGAQLGQGSWAWSDGGPPTSFRVQLRARNRVDPDTGSAHEEALVISEEWWQADAVQFLVEPIEALSQEQWRRDSAVLQASAFAVTAIGSWRNRGMGTVTIRPTHRLPELVTEIEKVLR